MNRQVFNIRVYGIWTDPEQRVLVTDEIRYGTRITKFPGGGLLFGEGPMECLKREWREETGTDVLIRAHFYTTDFFVPSAFDPSQQVISIFYLVEPAGSFNIPLKDMPFEFEEEKEGAQVFRKIPISLLRPDVFTFPIEKEVARRISMLDGK